MYETVEVPFISVGNRQVLTVLQTVEMPWLMEFIQRFPSCFEYVSVLQVWIYHPDGDAISAALNIQERTDG